MRSDDKSSPRSFPAIPGSQVRICPACEKTFLARTGRQRYCDRACYDRWQRVSAKRRRPPRFDLLVDREPAPIGIAVEPEYESTWASRSEYWETVASTTRAPASIRRSRALVLTGHGVKLRVDGGALVICEGFTHYPQPPKEHRFFPGDRRMPAQIVLVSCDGYLTLPVLEWINRQGITLVVLDWSGCLINMTGLAENAPSPALRSALLHANDAAKLSLARGLIEQKIIAQLAVLDTFRPSLTRTLAISKIRRTLEGLRSATATNTLKAVLLAEAVAAGAYFSVWQDLPLRWKGLARRPIPAEWSSVGGRQSLYGKSNRNATHPVQCAVNYAYGILEAQVRIALAARGLDPTLGILHARHPGRPSLVFDLMEPLRPAVDRCILDFVRSHNFTRKDFVITDAGVCRLHPQLARAVAALSLDKTRVLSAVDAFCNAVQIGAKVPDTR